jgi:hypothetical protein
MYPGTSCTVDLDVFGLFYGTGIVFENRMIKSKRFPIALDYLIFTQNRVPESFEETLSGFMCSVSQPPKISLSHSFLL